jgi:hypothetical protein
MKMVGFPAGLRNRPRKWPPTDHEKDLSET